MATMTTFTRRLLAQASSRGFHISTRPHGNRILVWVNQPGTGGTFGCIYLGRRSGRITGGFLHRGNTDDGTRLRNALEVSRAIRQTPPV